MTSSLSTGAVPSSSALPRTEDSVAASAYSDQGVAAPSSKFEARPVHATRPQVIQRLILWLRRRGSVVMACVRSV